MHIGISTGDCANTSKYGNELSGMLNKVSNSTPVYVGLCQCTGPAIMARAIEEILSWPPLDFYCDPRVQSQYEKYDIPALDDESNCD